jgi:hypothetical protein
MKISLPTLVLAGDLVDIASAEEWAQTLSQVSGGNISASVIPIQNSQLFSNFAQRQGGLGVYFVYYQNPDYPDPAQQIDLAISQGNVLSASNDWTTQFFDSLPANETHMININGTAFTQDRYTLGSTETSQLAIPRLTPQ